MIKDKNKAIEKINFLIDFAISQKSENNPYIYDYIKISFNLAKKYNYRIPSMIHRKVCKKCFSIRSSDNTKIRTVREKKNGVFVKYIKINCLSCGFLKKIRIL